MGNNFKRLEEQWRTEHGEAPNSIREDIHNSRSLFGLISDIFELSLPRIFELIIQMFSPDKYRHNDPEAQNDNKYPNLDQQEKNDITK